MNMKLPRTLLFSFASLAFALRTFAADSNAAATATVVVPPPVPDYPIGWCIRAKPEGFADAKSARVEYVEIALQGGLALGEENFEKLAAELRRLNLRALSGYNPVPKEMKLVGPDVSATNLDAHVDRLVSRA